MMTGVVKFFDANANYGFIEPHEGKHDVFFHRSVLDGLTSLKPGQWVQFDIVPDYRHKNGTLKAVWVALCGPKKVRANESEVA